MPNDPLVAMTRIRATAHDVDRRLNPPKAARAVVRAFSRRRSNARLASRGEDDRTEGSWSFLLVLAIERGRREDDGRWTRETRERERETRGVRWERVDMRAIDGSSRDARARGATSRARTPTRADEGVRRGRRNSRRETRAWMWAIALAVIAWMATMVDAGAELVGGSTRAVPELFAGGNIGPGANRWWIGAEVQLHSRSHNRFVKINGRAGIYATATEKRDWTNPPRFTAAAKTTFRVVDIGGGFVAFHNAKCQCFLRMRDNQKIDGSDRKGAYEYPHPHWTWPRWRIADAGDGEIGLYNEQHGRMNGANMDTSSHRNEFDLPS